MNVRYEDNPLITCIEAVEDFFNNGIDRGNNNLDDIEKAILISNGSEIKDYTKCEYYPILKNAKLFLCFIRNGKCNNKTLFYDIINMYGTTIIYIFADMFDDMNVPIIVDGVDVTNTLDKKADELLGNSVYYDMLKQIYSIICDYFYPFNKNTVVSGTILNSCNLINPVYMAAYTLNKIALPLRNQDVDSEPLMSADTIIDRVTRIPIKLLLLGITEDI